MEKNHSSATTFFISMNTEFVTDSIFSRLDGSTLAASACSCSHLRDAAADQNLWKNLCTAMWPSTQGGPSLLANGGFHKFYADAFPLILCQSQHAHTPMTPNPTSAHGPPSDLTSFVDIYYKGKCILSKVLDAIPEPFDVYNDDESNTTTTKDESDDEILEWLLDCPFRLDLLPYSDGYNDDYSTDHVFTHDNDFYITYLSKHDPQDDMAEDVRLSWILYDKKNRKAVNLSSWKPMFVNKSFRGENILQFGSIIPLGASLFAECKIEVRFRLIQDMCGYAKWTEISMKVEDINGAHLGFTKCLSVFYHALNNTKTSTNHLKVNRANNEYNMYKIHTKIIHDRRKYLVDKLYALVGLMVLLATISYSCTRRLF